MGSNIPNFDEFDDLVVTKIVKVESWYYFSLDNDTNYLESLINKATIRNVSIKSENEPKDVFLDLDYLFTLVEDEPDIEINSSTNYVRLLSNKYGCVALKIKY